MNNDLEIAGHKLNCDFMKLMPDFLNKELIDVLNKYKIYCDKDAKCINDEYELYLKNKNGVSMIFSVTGFIEAWNSYPYSIKKYDPIYSIYDYSRSVWTTPSKFFKNLERNFLDKHDNFFFKSELPASLEKELQNKIDQYCNNDIMACEKVLNDMKEEKN